MHDAARMGSGKSTGDLHGIVGRSPRHEIAGPKQVAQRRALEQLADEIRRALVRADVVQREHVRDDSAIPRFALPTRTDGGGQDPPQRMTTAS